MPAGRPKLNTLVTQVYIRLSLREGEDDDLLKAFQSIPQRKRAAFVKASMRSGGLEISADDLPDDDELAESLDTFLM
jgi:hypothetical protein